MIVYRNGIDDLDADRDVLNHIMKEVDQRNEPAVRVWYPPAHVAFGRRDQAADGYERARRAAESRGYPVTVREAGGRAVAFTGGVLALVRAEPADLAKSTVDARYERALVDLESALARLGVDAERGEPPASFCPGTRSLSAGGKLLGLAQRVRADVAVLGGLLVVEDADAIAAVLEPVYDALEVSFEPSSVGSVTTAGDQTDVEAVRRAVEDVLVGDRDATVRRVRET